MVGDDNTDCSTESGSAVNKQCHQLHHHRRKGPAVVNTPALPAGMQPAVKQPSLNYGDQPQHHRMATLMAASRIQPSNSQRILSVKRH